ncbi:MAG: hypothetical protein M1834_002234 [Cirrosporium novae-zelandiae]|nr:MAG: hypothetical protein M1834_002234 [Cirrosporium novae-zelandiae]
MFGHLDFLITLSFALFAFRSAASDNGLARTPAMGWNTWNAFGCDVSEELLLQTARKITDYGLQDAGYHYIVLDDCWSAGRTANGSLKVDTTKFPNGMRHVAGQLHDMGFGFGMYSDAGKMTCGKYMGSLGYERIDAQTFANWHVDYLKYDNCYNEGQSGTPLITYNRYKVMSNALNTTGRSILYSVCNWGEDYPWKWGQTMCNSWRMSGDLTDSFDRPDTRCPCTGDEGYDCALPGFHCSAMNVLNKVTGFVDKGIPGSWNDLDMLQVGNGGMSDDEYKIHFSMWAAVKSPLLMGNDIRSMSVSTLSILSNPAVLAISQDPSGSSAVRRWRYFVNDTDEFGQGEIQMWSGSLDNGDEVVALVNAGNEARTMNATLRDIFWDDGGKSSSNTQAAATWDVYDLWANRMSDSVASQIISNGNNNLTIASNDTLVNAVNGTYYNATAISYAQGLANNDTRLFGEYVTRVQGLGTITTQVPRHGISLMRLRQVSSSTRKRNEL